MTSGAARARGGELQGAAGRPTVSGRAAGPARGKTEEGGNRALGGRGREGADRWARSGSEREKEGSAGLRGKRAGVVAHAGEERKGGCWASGLAHAGRKGEERERVLGWAEGEGSGPAGWAPFYSFSFSTLH
jgi:hypothetical protein